MANPEGFFKGVETIGYEGPESDNPLAYRYYDKSRMVHGRTMEEHLRMAVCYWHTFCWDGHDIFGAPTFQRPWLAGAMDARAARRKMDAAFEFMQKLGAPYYCFHDVDVMAAANTLDEHLSNFAAAVDGLEAKQAEIGIKPLWGTANITSHPRYAGGAATNPDPEVFAFAATQVRACLEATHRLGGVNFVFWGGREGYDTLLNTDMRRELDQLGRLMALAVNHKHKIGFKGPLLIEPKPHEPSKHQYDFDTATVYGFLKRYGLEKDVRVNIEANHATLAGHSFEHEVATAFALDIFGSIDINRGDPQNGWDTDQFPNDVAELTMVMYRILKGGGFKTGGFNFDSKVRRQSVDPIDLFHGHIGGIDTLARGLLNAAALIDDGKLDAFVEERYAGWSGPLGQSIFAKDATLDSVADAAIKQGVAPQTRSGRQEYLENLVNRFIK